MNKTVLITGGSRGIGKAMVYKFAQAGYNVLLNFNKSDVKVVVNGGVKSLASLSWDIYAETGLKDRARFIRPNMFEEGDILLLQIEKTPEKDEAYVFINGALCRYKSGKFEQIKSSKLTSFLNNLMGKNYIIFRPYK